MSAWPSCYNVTQTINYQGCHPTREKLSDQPNKIFFFFRESYGTAEFPQFEECLAEHGTDRISRIMKTNSRYKSPKKSHNSKFRLIPRYANACMFIFSVLSRYNFTFAMPIHGFFSFILHLSSFWLLGSRDSCWPTLGRVSKSLRNTGLQGQITVHVLGFNVLDTKGIRMSVASSARFRCVTTNNFCCSKPVWFF
jgi:hypothetical protein